MTDDSVNVRVHKAKVKIEGIAFDLAEIGLESIWTRLRAISKELGDINSILDSQFMELKGKEDK